MAASIMTSSPNKAATSFSVASKARPASRCAAPSRALVTCSAHKQQKAASGAAAAAASAALALQALPAAADVGQAAADASNAGLALGGGAAVAALSAALLATDPEKRRQEQMKETSGDELEAVKKYFNTEGFNRWNKIYGETDDVNKVQLDIRNGHAMTVEKTLAWFKEEGNLEGTTVCDAGCGTGSLAIPLALEGATVSASDISSSMANEARERYEKAAETATKLPAVAPKFETKDLESCSGKYHTVTCLDVMIHYPQDKADAMVGHLASLAEERIILSFAPYTPWLGLLKRIGELFPGPSKATRAYLHAEADVEASLNAAGFKVVKREMTSTQFYFSRLLEAVRA